MLRCHSYCALRFLGCEPYVIDSCNVSPQMRQRFFWTNLPGVAEMIATNKKDIGPTLDSCLDENLGRQANVSKVGTITTKRSCFQDSNYNAILWLYMMFISDCRCRVLIIDF